MVLNDPAALELGPQGTIVSALLSHLNDQDLSVRRYMAVFMNSTIKRWVFS